MKSLGQRWSFACVVASLAAWLGVTSPASAQVPRTMTVQGILRDASGVPVEAATTLRFELLDGETAVWTEQQSVTPRAGLFTVRLGAETPLDPADFANALALRISVDGEAMAPIPLSTVPYAFRAETVDAYDGDVAWGQLTGVPAGFADGTDDGASYAAGAGLTLTGDTFAVDASTVQTRVTGACMPGSSIRAIAEDGTVTCEADDEAAAGASYEAGEGLLLMGTTFSIDTSTVQARVSGTCAPGSAIRSIGSDGTVICEADDVGPSYTAGAGLTLTGTTFSVDTSAVQARVSGTCAAGSSVRSIGSDGTVICEADDVGPSYTAGAGLALTGTTFSVDPALVQVRVSGTCLPGSSVRAIGADGTVTCEADDVGPTYVAGSGLTLMGTTLSVDATAIQARVNATCPVGSSIRAIGPDGSVTCQTDASTSYSAGTGLTLTGTTFTPDTTYLQRRVAASCTAGAAIRAIAADGTVTCEPMPTTVDDACSNGLLIDGVCMLSYDNTLLTDWNTAATTCAGQGGDVCTESEYLALVTPNDGWHPNFFYASRAVWTAHFSDNDAGRVFWLNSSDDPTISQVYSYACCRHVAPAAAQARGTLIPATGSTQGVRMTYIHNREDTAYPTAANICHQLRSDLCSRSEYVILNDAGRFSASLRRASTNLSDNDGSRFSAILGTNTADNPSWADLWAFACCAPQRPADGSCPGTIVNNVCTVDLHTTEDATFFDAARACGRLGADVCTNSEMQNIRNAGRFGGVRAWTNEGADNDSSRVGGLLFSQPDDPNPATDRFGYACCL